MTVCLNEIRRVITSKTVPRNTMIFKDASNHAHQHNVSVCAVQTESCNACVMLTHISKLHINQGVGHF